MMSKIVVLILLYIIYLTASSEAAGKCLARTAVGLEKRKILDNAITSSSFKRSCWFFFCTDYYAHYARLFNSLPWEKSDSDSNSWIQVDLGSTMTVTKIVTQGHKTVWSSTWITRYTISFADYPADFKPFNNNQVFSGNTDGTSIVDHVFEPPIVARYIRLYPTEFKNSATLKMELYTGICPAVNYYLGELSESCDETCHSHDQVCLDIDHGFDSIDVKKRMESALGRICLTDAESDIHENMSPKPIYKPQNGKCLGWKNVAAKINCKVKPGSVRQRFCPCNKVKHGRICEDTGGYLHCTNSKAIKVVNANYGRTEYDVCPHDDIKTIDCRDGGLSLDIVSNKCQGKAYCDIWVSDKTMGSDQCTTTKKYLQVEYKCTGNIKEKIEKADNCSFPLGMENGTIPDSYITASSSLSEVYKSHHARLNFFTYPGAWCAGKMDTEQYLQVEFETSYIVTKIAIQGRRIEDQWVTAFSLAYRQLYSKIFLMYKKSKQEVVFLGNKDRSTIVLHHLNPTITAKGIRIHPKSWHSLICLRTEFYGCEPKPECSQNFCKRCKISPAFPKMNSSAALSGHVTGKFLAFDNNMCQMYCLRDRFCVSFNFGPPLQGTQRDCEISNSDHLRHPQDIVSRDGYEYYSLENACSRILCQNNGSCQPDFEWGTYRCICQQGFTGKMCESDIDECSGKANDCDPIALCLNTFSSYSCVCPENTTGDGKLCYVPETCTEILEYNGNASSGSYYLQQKDGLPQPVYCYMEQPPGCTGLGWTMVMKIDGNKSTFNFTSTHWSEKTALNPEAGTNPFQGAEETKLHTYWSTPFTKLCLGMSLSTNINWLEIQQSSASLFQLIAGTPLPIWTNAGKEAWLSLVEASTWHSISCTTEAFNNQSKIGFQAFSDSGCKNILFYNGFGLTTFGCGSKDKRPFCYIMIK